MIFWSLAAVATLAVAGAEELSCPPCDVAEWKLKSDDARKQFSACADERTDLTAKFKTCDNSLTEQKTMLSTRVTEVEKLTKTLSEKEQQLSAASSSVEKLASMKQQLDAAVQEKAAALESSAKNAAALQEKEKLIHSVKEERDAAMAASTAAQIKEQEVKENLVRSVQTLKRVQEEYRTLKTEMDSKNNAVFDKEKFMTLCQNLWVFSKAGFKSLAHRVRKLVGDDKFYTGVDMAVIYWTKAHDAVHTYAVQPAVTYYNAYGAAATAPVIAKATVLVADNQKKVMVHVHRGLQMVEAHMNKQVDAWSSFEPKIAEMMPASFEDRLFAVGFVSFCLYHAAIVLGTIGNMILATISFVCCCRRRNLKKDKKKSHKGKSSSADAKKDRKGSLSGSNKPEQPKTQVPNPANNKPVKR